MQNKEEIKEILILANTPDISIREALWFSENEKKIKNLAKINNFWQKNSIILEKDQKINLSELLRKIHELGYTKVQNVLKPGEFSQKGGVIYIFPVNHLYPFAIDLFGNQIEEIIPKKELEISDEERIKKLKESKQYKQNELKFEKGDYVIHIDHGIGIFKEEKIINNEKYYVLEYAPPKQGALNDTLFVPESQSQKLSLYIGLQRPIIHRLSGNLWEKTLKKAKEDTEKFAKELVEIYSKRIQAKKTPCKKDDLLQKEFNEDFEHIETPDQTKAWNEIKKDMESETPMDRLLCGDVGFGKTEIAMRAAFKAVNSGYQVAVLCPTTLLSDQHFENFKERFKKFPVMIEKLTRFESEKTEKEIIKKISNGEVDIVIGTHKILSDKISFKNLGLLIIDEEQRFGVRQKEKLKKIKTNIDTLSITATPIPRTLYMSLSGLRQISQINTPPLGKESVETIISEKNDEILKSAIEYELQRGGQIYLLHNKIITIEKRKKEIENLIKDAKIKIAHSKLSEKELKRIMDDFKSKKFDILIATTIIENGLDIKNVNTLIVDNAEKLGLAQAHQIRGRVGRHTQKAFAYFFYDKEKVTENGIKRLEALKRFSHLGAGYEIAKKDLEIRGAGDILGKNQSGTLNQVGLNLYCEMLNQAIERLKS